MFEPIKNFARESNPVRILALTAIIFLAIIVGTSVWSYVRLVTHRSGAPVEKLPS